MSAFTPFQKKSKFGKEKFSLKTERNSKKMLEMNKILLGDSETR